MRAEALIPDGYGLHTQWWAKHLEIDDTNLARRFMAGMLATSKVTVDARRGVYQDGKFSGYWIRKNPFYGWA